MCTYVTNTVEVVGSGYLGEDWFGLDRAVVYFDHPQDAPVDHALCLDVWGGARPCRDRARCGLGATAGRDDPVAPWTTTRCVRWCCPRYPGYRAVGADGRTRSSTSHRSGLLAAAARRPHGEFAELREQDPFLAIVRQPDERVDRALLRGHPLRGARRDQPPPEDFCSGKGAVSIPDLPAEALEFFGSFINMDDPRHARQRGIVVALVHAAPAAGGARLGRDDLRRGDRRHVRAGRGRPRRGALAAVPAAGHLRHDGHPAQRVRHGARATNVILGAGDPDMLGGGDPMTAMFEAGMQPPDPDERARRGAPGRTRPTTSPPRSCTTTSARTCWRRTRSRRSSSCSRSPATTPPAPRSAAACTCSSQNPDQRAHLAGRPRRRDADRGRGDRARRVAGHLHASHRDHRRHACRATTSPRATRSCCSTASPTATRACSTTPNASTSGAIRTRTSASVGRARTSASARTSLAARSRSRSGSCSTRLPDIEVVGEPVRSRRWASRWSAASSTCRSASRPTRRWGDSPRRSVCCANDSGVSCTSRLLGERSELWLPSGRWRWRRLR